MAIDYAVTVDCEPKRHFGNGDCQTGVIEILEKLKSRGRAEAVRKLMQQKGADLFKEQITLNVYDRDGNPVQKQVTVAELEAEAQPLDEHAAACNGCAVNFLGKAYGCFGVINYPVSAAGEAWLAGRMQPPGSFGADLCADFISEFGVTGESIARMRKEGLLEAKWPAKIILRKKFLKSVSISTDQLLETLFMVGDSLKPSHCLGVLLWLGAIRVDGQVPATAEDPAPFVTLTSLRTAEERQKRTRLEVGPQSGSDAEPDFRALVQALYLSWVYDAPLYISA